MPYRNDAARIEEMRHFVQRIMNELPDTTYERFSCNSVLQRATLYHLVVLGEASSNLSHQFKQEHEHVSWVQIEKVGRKLVHEYFKVDLELVYATLTSDMPTLLLQLESITQKLTPTRTANR
ncbi:MAG: DUF86 domain-containing protein [Gammaproteobacteria bacterium]|nr:DUF86 domain-containing protein [Gammaproteobacteria bacterium]